MKLIYKSEQFDIFIDEALSPRITIQDNTTFEKNEIKLYELFGMLKERKEGNSKELHVYQLGVKDGKRTLQIQLQELLGIE